MIKYNNMLYINEEEPMRKILFPGALILMVLATMPIFAHDLWLVPDKFTANPGESLTLFANTGMDFPNSLNAITKERIDRFILIGKTGEQKLSQFKALGKSLTAASKLKKPGTYVAAISLKPKEIKLKAKEFNEYLLHDGLSMIYELRKKKGILDKDAVEHYSKYAKTIIRVGNQLDDTPTEPLMLPIEIVPGVNPYSLKRGDSLEVTVFFKGQQLSNAELAWSFPGQGEKFAGVTKTDANGKAAIPLVKTGAYVIRLTHMEWVKKKTHEWESYWASLTFEVLPD
jgi:uncharacterized GH25 family protein